MLILIYQIKGVVNIEDYNLTLWEIFKNCYTGGYIGGEAFESENGKVAYFNGISLHSNESLDVKEKFKYLGDM